MLRTRSWLTLTVAGAWLVVFTASFAFAQDKPGAMAKEQQEMMDAMTKAATPGPNHKLLASMAGEWTIVNRMWMDPGAPPTESKGTASYEMMMGGRYLHGHYKGVMMGMPFEGVGVTGYDNVSQKFQALWIDNFGTGIMYMTGTYDPNAKALTFVTDMDDPMQPGTKVGIREVIRLLSPDQRVMEMYQNRSGKEMKMMEITYTRAK